MSDGDKPGPKVARKPDRREIERSDRKPFFDSYKLMNPDEVKNGARPIFRGQTYVKPKP